MLLTGWSISTIQRMYSILKNEELEESAEEASFNEYITADSKEPKEVVYNEKYPPEFFDCIIVDDECVIIRTKLEKPSKIKGLALI